MKHLGFLFSIKKQDAGDRKLCYYIIKESGDKMLSIIAIIAAAVLFAAGFAVGCLADIFRTKISGTLRVDCSDPDGPYLFLELSEEGLDISRLNTVTFAVKAANITARK